MECPGNYIFIDPRGSVPVKPGRQDLQKKQGAAWRPVWPESRGFLKPCCRTYFGLESLEVVAAASVFGFLLWCFFSVAGLAAAASVAGAAVMLFV